MKRRMIAFCLSAMACPALMAQGVDEQVDDLTRAADSFAKQTGRVIGNAERDVLNRANDVIRSDFRDRTRLDVLDRNQYRSTGRTTGMIAPRAQRYRGTAMSTTGWSGNRVYTLRYDANGREFICVNGQRVYFDQQRASQDMLGRSGNGDERYRAGYGSYDEQGNMIQDGQSSTDQQFQNQSSEDAADIDAPALDNRNLRGNADLDADVDSNVDANLDAQGRAGAQLDGDGQLRGDADLDARVDQGTDATLRAGGNVNANADAATDSTDIRAGANAAGSLNTSGETRANAAGNLNAGADASDAAGNLNTSDETRANASGSLNTSGETGINASGDLNGSSNLNTRGQTGTDAGANVQGSADLNTGSGQIDGSASGSISADGAAGGADAAADASVEGNL